MTTSLTWHSTNVPLTANWRSVCYGEAGLFVAIASGTDKLIGFDDLGKLILVDQSGDINSDRYLRIP